MLGHKFNARNIEHGLNFYSVYGCKYGCSGIMSVNEDDDDKKIKKNI